MPSDIPPENGYDEDDDVVPAGWMPDVHVGQRGRVEHSGQRDQRQSPAVRGQQPTTRVDSTVAPPHVAITKPTILTPSGQLTYDCKTNQ